MFGQKSVNDDWLAQDKLDHMTLTQHHIILRIFFCCITAIPISSSFMMWWIIPVVFILFLLSGSSISNNFFPLYPQSLSPSSLTYLVNFSLLSFILQIMSIYSDTGCTVYCHSQWKCALNSFTNSSVCFSLVYANTMSW